MQASFRRDGITIELGAKILSAAQRGNEKVITYEVERRAPRGRGRPDSTRRRTRPERGGPRTGERSASSTAPRASRSTTTLRTTNPHIYAAGDVCSRYQFTHAADALARIVIQNALFFGRKKMSALHIPWCTYTNPEVAHVGLNARDAAAAGIDVVDDHC